MDKSRILKAARKTAGLKMREVVEILGQKHGKKLTVNSLNRYEMPTNFRFPDFHTAKALVKIYRERGSNITMDDIGYGVD